MAVKIPRCPRCSGACQLKAVAAVSGQDGSLKITLKDLPVIQCEKGHKMAVHRDFMLWLIQEIRSREGEFAAGKEEGMIFKKHLCGSCGKPLAAKEERRHVFPYELKYEELAPFGLELEMPLYKCTACGKEQIRSTREVHAHVPGAIVGINDAAGFPHSG